MKNNAQKICMAAMILFFLIEQGVLNILPPPGRVVPLVIFKGLATLSAALCCLLGTRRAPSARNRLLTAGLFVCVAADVTLNLANVPGIALFMAAHACFCAAFYRAGWPGKGQIALYAAAVAVGAGLICGQRAAIGSGVRFAAVTAYMLILFAMVALSIRQTPRLRAGALIFALSDILLGLNAVLTPAPWSRFASLAVYYVALALISAAPWREQSQSQTPKTRH